MSTLDDNSFIEKGKITITEGVSEMFLSMAKWMKFMAIVGFVLIGIMFVAGIGMMLFGSSFSFNGGEGSAAVGIVTGLIYLVITVIYFYPVLYLYKAATGIKKGFSESDQEAFEDGIYHHRRHYKLIGLYTLVLLSLYVIAILIIISFSR